MLRRRKRESPHQALVRTVQERDEALELLERQEHMTADAREAYRAMAIEMQEQRARHDSFVAQVTASLSEVAVYEGMPIGPASVLRYLSELVRDHEELERRIDLAILECRGEPVVDSGTIVRILQGSVKTPDQVDG